MLTDDVEFRDPFCAVCLTEKSKHVEDKCLFLPTSYQRPDDRLLRWHVEASYVKYWGYGMWSKIEFHRVEFNMFTDSDDTHRLILWRNNKGPPNYAGHSLIGESVRISFSTDDWNLSIQSCKK